MNEAAGRAPSARAPVCYAPRGAQCPMKETLLMPGIKFALTLLFGVALVGGGTNMAEAKQGIRKQPLGTTADGRAVDLYTLTNSAAMQARITNYGGIVVSLMTPDRNGSMDDVVLGFDSLDGYLQAAATSARYRPLWQSHRQGRVHARRHELHARQEQRREPPSRRPKASTKASGRDRRAAGRPARS